MAIPNPFGEALAAQLRRRGWSQRAFAARTGEHQSLVVRVAQGTRLPPLGRLGRWLEVLEPDAATADELLRLALAAHGAHWIAARLGGPLARAAETPEPYRAGRGARRRPRRSSPGRRRR